jgi:hypothetical protein
MFYNSFLIGLLGKTLITYYFHHTFSDIKGVYGSPEYEDKRIKGNFIINLDKIIAQ